VLYREGSKSSSDKEKEKNKINSQAMAGIVRSTKCASNAKISHDNNVCSTHIILMAVYNLNS